MKNGDQNLDMKVISNITHPMRRNLYFVLSHLTVVALVLGVMSVRAALSDSVASLDLFSVEKMETTPIIRPAQTNFVYQNPIVSEAIDGGIRDPDIINWDNKYYLTGTCYPFSRVWRCAPFDLVK